MWDLIVSVPDHCLSFYFTVMFLNFPTYRSGQKVYPKIRLFLEEQSDQVLHCLPLRLHLLAVLFFGKANMFEF